jgi:hypothetical protein
VTAVRLGLAAGLLALAAVAALLAGDVRSWQRTLVSGDAVYAADPARASWTPTTTRIGDVAGDLLGTGDALAVRRALRLYRATVGLHPTLDDALGVATVRAHAQDALDAAAQSAAPASSSQARTLLGVLAFGALAGGAVSNQLDTAVSDFTSAIRADPRNETAKYDLELLLRLAAVHGQRPGQAPGHTGGSGRKGAAAGLSGHGY